MKEIHFHKDSEDELAELGKALCEEYDFKHFYRSHNDTIREIKKEIQLFILMQFLL